MSAVFSWFKYLINRYIWGKVTPILIEKITDVKSLIPEQTKQDLLASIRTNNPTQFAQILQNPNNGIPDSEREDLKAVLTVGFRDSTGGGVTPCH